MATKRQLARAARLYRLAVIAHMDLSGDGEQKVRSMAIDQAVLELSRLGYEPRQLLSEDDCLRAAEVK